MAAVLASFCTAVEIARHAAGYPAAVLGVPGVVFAFVLARRRVGAWWPEELISAATFTVLAGATVWIGSQLTAYAMIGGAAFVVLMSGAVWARRFGPRVTRLGALIPPALIAALISGQAGAASVSWWPICGWYALTGFSAFVWIRAARWLQGRLSGVPEPGPVPAPAARPQRKGGGLSIHTRAASQMAVALTVALVLGHLLFGSHWPWAVISAMVVNLGTLGRGDVVLKGIERGLGAMAGTVIGAVIATAADPHGTASIIAIFVALATASALRPYGYAFYACGITTVLSLLYGYFGEPAQHLLTIRLEALALGAATAVAVGWFVMPVRRNDALRVRLLAVLGTLTAFFAARRDRDSTAGALAAFDAACETLAATTRPHRLHRAVAQRIHVTSDVPSEDAGEVLLSARAAVHATAATEFSPDERASAKAIGLLRKALAAPGEPVPALPAAAASGPLADLDAALARLAVKIENH
ncbi:FUSC family protein [Hamadaea tsunoensis]|uniref:FUSC family protein n=1 Tax=Hamadaea tsunoensis TaxID=53368 RepID=UPI00146F9679|nr:FUSC family protein [Hamadaea tsunoensis]